MEAKFSQIQSHDIYVALIFFVVTGQKEIQEESQLKSVAMDSEIKEPTPLYLLYNTVFQNKPCNGTQVQYA